MFYYREEVYEYLCTQGVEPNDAQKASELVRKGFGYSMPHWLNKALEGYSVDESFFRQARNILWLPKRGTDGKPDYLLEAMP